MGLPNQTGGLLRAHLHRRHRPLLILVVAGAIDPEEEAELSPMTGPDESVDHRVNRFGLGQSSPNSFDHTCDFLFRLPNAFLRFRQLSTHLRCHPGVLDLVLSDPVTDRGSTDTGLNRSSEDRSAGTDGRESSCSGFTGQGHAMGEVPKEKPDFKTIESNQTMGHVRESTKPTAAPSIGLVGLRSS